MNTFGLRQSPAAFTACGGRTEKRPDPDRGALQNILIGLLLFACATTVRAATHYVAIASTNPVSPYITWATAATNIQDAVDAALAGETVLVSNGVYATGGRATPGYMASNRVVITKNITVQSMNGPAATSIAGGFGGNYVVTSCVRCVFITNGTLSGFTLTNGATPSSVYGYFDQDGAGVYADGGTVNNCLIKGCRALGNGSGARGGTLNNCTLVGNSASTGGGSYGGTLNNCLLSSNSATYGGGSCLGTLNNCVISGNKADQLGGGSMGGTQNNCWVSGNITVNGSGGGSYGGTLNNCVLTGNSAWDGSACDGGTLNNCTVYSNYTSQALLGGTQNNCIVYFNAGGNYDNTSILNYSCTTPMPAIGTGNITNNPQFVDSAHSNVHLVAASPCINAGSNSYVVGSTDMDNKPRIINGRVDMGAYEYRGAGSSSLVWYVAMNGSDFAAGTNWASPKQTIQAAVDLTIDGDTVTVSNGVYATGGRPVPGYILTNRVIMTNNITLQSVNGPALTTIAGAWTAGTTNGDAAVRCVYVGGKATVSGFTLVNGATRTTGNLYIDASGGGVWCTTNVVVSNCALIANSSKWYGGGSYQGTLNNCSFTSNSSESGGGSYQSVLSNCTVSGNVATFGGGTQYGILYNCTVSGNTGGGACNGTFYNCVISGNTSSGSGGGSVGSTLYNCTLTGNAAANGGGTFGGTLYNCRLTGNTAAYGGGCENGTLYNCTVAGNRAQFGSGTSGGTLHNCIVYTNLGPGGNCYNSTLDYSCTMPMAAGAGNITNDPRFVDTANSNFHLKATSPCIDAGSNAFVQGAADLDGNLRIVNGRVDMGAYEAGPRAVVSVAASPANGGTVSGASFYFSGSNATLQATANPYWQFVNWNDGDTNATRSILVPTSNVTYTANFSQRMTIVSVQANPPAGGTVAGGGTYQAGSNVTISAAAANSHWFFTGWNDGDANLTRTITVPASNITYTATFTQQAGAIIFYVATNGSDAADGLSWATAKQTIQAAITASVNYDLILVTNGVYRENICFTGKNVTVASLFLVNSNASYIDQTIIQGTGTGSVVRIANGETSNAILTGFTITNGYSAGNKGGGIYCYSVNARLENLKVKGNRTDTAGGGINFESSTGSVRNCEVSGNAAAQGGGIACYYSTPDIINVTVSGNTATIDGGGFQFYHCSPTSRNVLAVGNYAIRRGGGIAVDALSPVFENCTVCNNGAGMEGGGICPSYASHPRFMNSILWSNSPQQVAYDSNWFGMDCTFAYSDVQDGMNGIVTHGLGAANWLTGNLQADPAFARVSDFHLLTASPCIDTGSNAYLLGTTDLDGNPRIVNGTVDMGAYEAGPRAVVSVATNPVEGGIVSGGGTFFAGTNATIQATPNAYWLFTGWNDGDTNATRDIIVPASNITYTANFTPQLATVSVATNPVYGGAVTGGGTYQVNSSVVISAAPNANWLFVNWNDGDTNATRTVTVPATDSTFTANFTQQLATVSIDTNPVFGGTVTGGGTYQTGSNILLSATPEANWLFVSWSDGATNPLYWITVPATDITYTANFTQQMATVILQGSPSLGGSVTGGGSYQTGSNVVISATPNAYWRFVNWNDGDTNVERTITVPETNALYVANFIQQTASLSVQADPPKGGTTTGSGIYQAGSNVVISATPNPGWRFVRWNDGDTLSTRTVSVPVEGATYDAHFRLHAPFDFDGDGKSDLALFTKSTGYWDVMPSSGGTNLHFKFGSSSTKPAVADYDADARDDFALRNNSTLKWYILRSFSSTLVTTNWGGPGTIAVPADYDGDGKADPATYKPDTGLWVIGLSSNGALSKMNWGRSTGIPVMADYNGDGRADRAVYQRFTGKWYIFNSDGTTNTCQWGWPKAMPVPGDYDGDGKTDIGVYAPSNGMWYVKCSGGGTIVQQWGNSKSAPVPGDYDGDGITDMAVYRPSNGIWYIQKSSGGTVQIQFGNSLAAPASLQFVLNRMYYPTP